LEVDDVDTDTITSVDVDLNGDGVYEYTLASTDFYLYGYNDRSKGFPYNRLELSPYARYTFSKARKGNKVTTTWGWASVPKPVQLACILQSNREYQRFKTALGVSGATAVGTITLDIPALDPDVEKLLQQYKRLT
jgi:hypothetical protein